MAQALAVVFTIIMLSLAVFQGLLIAGYPLGQYAWGGYYKVLPRNLRYASAFSIILYLFMVTVILDRSGILKIYSGAIRTYGAWAICAYMTLGIFVNAISRSQPERRLMTPVVAILAIIAFIVASAQ